MSTKSMPATVAKRLGYAIKQIQHALRARMDEVLRPLMLTTPQYAVLSAVEAEPGLSNARLARAAFVTPQTMQAMLANLERDGQLQRLPDPTHGRVLRSELTIKGRKALAQAHIAVRGVEDVLVSSFGASNANRIAASLAKCADDLRLARKEREPEY